MSKRVAPPLLKVLQPGLKFSGNYLFIFKSVILSLIKAIILIAIFTIALYLVNYRNYLSIGIRSLLVASIIIILEALKRDHSYKATGRGLCVIGRVGPSWMMVQFLASWTQVANCTLENITDHGKSGSCLVITLKDGRKIILPYDPNEEAIALELCYYIRRKVV